MIPRSLALLAMLASSTAAMLVTACSGDTTNGDGGTDATLGDVATSDVANDVGTGDTGTSDAGGGKDGCAPGAGCRACCAGLYPDAAASVRAFEVTCACASPGDCEAGAECGNSLCNAKPPSMACTACLRDPDAGDCQSAAIQACKADTTCAPYLDCVLGCQPGPADAGGAG